MAAQGVPQPLIDGFSSVDPAAQGELTNVGTDLGQQILASLPDAARSTVEPFIGAIVEAIHQAFSIAIGNTMWLAVVAAIVAAAVVTVVVPELNLRRTTGAAASSSDAPASAFPVME